MSGPVLTEAQREQALAIYRRTRAEQGLPPTIQDPTVLAQAAHLYRAYLDEQRRTDKGAA